MIRLILHIMTAVLTVKLFGACAEDAAYKKSLNPAQKAAFDAAQKKFWAETFVTALIFMPVYMYFVCHMGEIGSFVQKLPSYLP